MSGRAGFAGMVGVEEVGDEVAGTLTIAPEASPRQAVSEESQRDHGLLERMIDRDNRAWAEFLRRYNRMIYAIIHSVIKRSELKHTIDYKDVHAAFLVELVANDMHKLRAFDLDRGYALSTWVRLLATNATLDYVRSSSRRAARAKKLAVHSTEQADGDLVAQVSARLACERLVRWMERRLSPRDCEFFARYYVQCASPEEVSESMGISVKTVYAKNFKLRSRMASIAAH